MGKIIKAGTLKARPKPISPDVDLAAADLIAAHAGAVRIREETRDDVIDLALSIAKKVIGKAIELDPEMIDTIYSKALAAGRDIQSATLAVHPDDRASSAVDALARAYHVDVVDDPDVGRAGCRIQGGGAEVDATLDGVLKALEAAMKGLTHG